MVKQAKIAFLTWPTDSKVASIIDWTVIWRVPSSFFENISSAIFLSENAFLRNTRKQAKKKKEEGKKSLEDLAASVSPVIRKARCQTSKDWSPMIAKLQLFESETVVGIQRKENRVASSLFFFRRKQSQMLGKRKVKVTENCVENTDFAYAATSWPGHMPRQLPARLSGIPSWAYVYNKCFGLRFMTNKPEAEAFIVFRFNSETLRVPVWPVCYRLSSCKRRMTTQLHTRHRQSDIEAWRTWVNAVHAYAWYKVSPTHTKQCMHSLSFLIPTRMRHACTFFSPCGRSCGLTFRADDVFLRKKKKTFLAVSSVCSGGKPGRQVCMMPGFSQESRGRQVFEFGQGVADATLVGRRICFTFFRSHQRERLAQWKFGYLLRRALREWQRCERAVCHVAIKMSIQVLFRDKTMSASLLWPGNQEASTCSTTKRQATRIGTPSRRLVNLFHPQRSDKSPNGSGWTNFVNLKQKSCF